MIDCSNLYARPSVYDTPSGVLTCTDASVGFYFSNMPEGICDANWVAAKTLTCRPYGARLQSETLSPGSYLGYWQHGNTPNLDGSRKLSFAIYIGASVTNVDSVPIAVTVSHRGVRAAPRNADPNASVVIEVWADYFASTLNESYTLQPGQTVWLFRMDTLGLVLNPPSSSNPYGDYMNAAVAFGISGGRARVDTYAYGSIADVQGLETTIPYDEIWVESGFGSADASGVSIAPGSDGSQVAVAGAVKVCDFGTINISSILNTTRAYRTHNINAGNVNEMLWFRRTEPDGTYKVLKPGNWPCGLGLANWGVQYDYYMRIYNDTSAPHAFRIYVSNYANTTAATPIGTLIQGVYKGCAVPGGQEQKVFEQTIQPGQTLNLTPWRFILCGNAGGGGAFRISAV